MTTAYKVTQYVRHRPSTAHQTKCSSVNLHPSHPENHPFTAISSPSNCLFAAYMEGERFVYTEDVISSNLILPTKQIRDLVNALRSAPRSERTNGSIDVK